jgi:ISXO2-like transposase domain
LAWLRWLGKSLPSGLSRGWPEPVSSSRREAGDAADGEPSRTPSTAEEYFSRLRRAEAGHHHHIAGAYLLRYAQESSWREDYRRVSNGDHTYRVAGLAMRKRVSSDFTGYWQRHLMV